MIQQSRKPLHPTALRNIAMAFSAAEIGLQICHRIPFEGGNCRIMMQPLDREAVRFRQVSTQVKRRLWETQDCGY